MGSIEWKKEKAKCPEKKEILAKGFTHTGEKEYTCGGTTKVVQEFKHNATGMEFVYIPGGTFQMGSTKWGDSQPIHRVTVPSFLIGKYEVTQAQWKAVMGSNPSNWKNDTCQ
jgi:formylglycine-generating enzyme required for sulfatase activity